MARPFLVDAHLDLAYNALRGREVLRPAMEQVARGGEEVPTVGLPDLHAGGVGLVCATLFAMPAYDGRPGYRTADEAGDVARGQLAWYREQVAAGHLRIVRGTSDLPHAQTREGAAIPVILLMEGADALRTPDDLAAWVDAGLRILGLAWRRTRFAGGTDCPGPLSAEGRAIVPHLDRLGVIHDASHLADDSFWQLMDLAAGPVMASHSNCRSFVPTDRQLSDEMIRAVVARDGVIGINFYDRFLLPPADYGKRRANLNDVVRHVDHICQLAGDARHVAIGTDLDGGLGRDEIPEEIVTASDLPKLAGALRGAGYGEADVAGILGGNWLRFFRRSLPPGPDEPRADVPRARPTG